MIKLKDIFNIDISSKGGGKLYKKIMRKYNIPLKDVKEVKQEIVDCSSGSGEGVKEYYYKCSINNNDEELLQMLNYFATFTNEFNVIVSAPLYTDDGLHKGGTENYEIVCLLIDTLRSVYISDNFIIGFRYKSRKFENYTTIESGWGPNIYASKHVSTVNVTALYDFFIKQGASEEELNTLNALFQEITKEEYESMITYKP